MLDHVGVDVRDIAAAKRFYEAALEPLGYGVGFDGGEYVGFRAESHPDFWVAHRGEGSGGAHVAFRGRDRAAVDAFHRAGIGAGGTDNGAPGVRTHYHENYYAAYVIDPDGNNVEAVCHDPA